MDTRDPRWNSPAIRHAAEIGSYGMVIRLARTAAKLTQAQLGAQLGLDRSGISRLETGTAPVRDVMLLRRLASVFKIPPELFGLSTQQYRPPLADDRSGASPIVRVKDTTSDGGDDPVRRRSFLAASAGLLGSAAAGEAFISQLEGVLINASTSQRPLPPSQITAAIAVARSRFQACRYRELAAGLPQLIAAATTNAATCPNHASHAALADVYNLATRLLIKLGDDGPAYVTADRALTAARVGGDPIAIAESSRMVSSVLRRTGHRATAQQVIETAATSLDTTGRLTARGSATLAHLWCTAAYTAAQDGNRDQALTLIGDAAQVAARLDEPDRRRYVALGSPANVTLHRISIAYLLGDAGTAITLADGLPPATIAVTERRARYHIDVARAYMQWNKLEPCYHSLLDAYQAAPEEVAGRPAIRGMVTTLLSAERARQLSGLRRFATRIGAA